MTKKRYIFYIVILGFLTALSPFSIDMYLPAFQDIAESLHTTTAKVDLSLSSFFVGLAFGQMIYGPLMDKFGRKKPLYVGMCLYIIASVACFLSTSVDMLIAARLVQAIGSCAAGVASVAMVRDLFPVKDSTKVFALLVLILGASPLVAPTVGGYLAEAFGWQSVFIVLLVIAAVVFFTVMFALPESYKPDSNYSLKPAAITGKFIEVIRNPQFFTYAVSGSLAFCGLFAYVAGSPLVFMDVFALSKKEYSWLFAGLSVGFIGSSQINSLLIKRFKSEQIIKVALTMQLLVGALFLFGSIYGWYGVGGTVAMIFMMLCCVGLCSPNTSALSMAPFSENAGVASAFLGTMQLGLGAVSSFFISVFHSRSTVPMSAVVACSSALALVVLLIGRTRIKNTVNADFSGQVGH